MPESSVELKLNLDALIANKNKLENDLSSLLDVLQSHGGVGMTEPLLDDQQFPRSDIDIYTVTKTRQQVACLRTDLANLLTEIEHELYKYHEACRMEKASGNVSFSSNKSSHVQKMDLPFARIAKIEPSSPADIAGLCVDDEITHFGSVHMRNFRSLEDVKNVATRSIDAPISIEVRRKDVPLRLSLTPRKWKGAGLLGCLIAPFS